MWESKMAGRKVVLAKQQILLTLQWQNLIYSVYCFVNTLPDWDKN